MSTPVNELNWSILTLFDTLMTYFRPEGADDGMPEELKGDRRMTWTAWRVLLQAAFGMPQMDLASDHRRYLPDTEEPPPMPPYPGVVLEETFPRGAAVLTPCLTFQEIFERCTGRVTWPKIQAGLLSLIVGRRGGKSYITAIIGIYLACCRKYSLNLGTKGMVMILARDKQQAEVIRGYVKSFIEIVPELRDMLYDEPTKSLIELKNGITIEIRAVGDAGPRGYTVVAALMDEIAFWPTDPESAKQDKKVLRAIQPSMLDIPGAMLVMLSSPYARRGELFETYRRHYGKDQSNTLVWNADTLSMRPSSSPLVLDRIREAYEDDPESAKAEYGAQFRSDLEAIFSREAVSAVSIRGRFEMGYDPKKIYRAFVDPSGGSSDSYVLAIAHDEKRRTPNGEEFEVPVLDKVKEWQAPFDPQAVSDEAVLLLKGYKIAKVTGDAYGGEWPRDPFRKKGIEYELAEYTRSELYMNFLPLVNSKRCELLDTEHHKRLVNQLTNLERHVGRSGKDSVDHPAGGHDDVANAVAGVMIGKTVAGMGLIW